MATSAVAHAGTAVPGQDLHCFVCDTVVTGRYYTLATCRTQNSKIRLIEKLGQLVGERYMVVISEDDIICRGCATLINTLDRLETEMGSVRAVVLRFLEKKYSLDDGELVNSKPTGAPAPPPQITPAANSQGKDKDYNRKRKVVSSDGESDTEWNDGKKKDSKSSTWMQCNKCKYTTDYNAFMIHHVISQKKKEAAKEQAKDSANTNASGESGGQSPDHTKPIVKKFKTEIITDADQNESETQQIRQAKVIDTDSGDSETVEMIAAEINDFHGSSNQTSGGAGDMVIAVTQHSAVSENPTVVAVPQGTAIATSADGNEVTIEVSGMVVQGEDGQPVANLEDGTTICMMPIGDEGSGERQAIMDETGESGVYVHVVDMSGQEVQGIVQGEVGEQHQDGTVEMVEVMWDQMVTNEDDGDGTQEINF